MAGEKTQPWCAIETDDYGNPTRTGNCKKDTCSKDKASKFARDKEKLLRVSTFSILACKVARGPHANKACKIPFDAGTHIANGCTISSDRNHNISNKQDLSFSKNDFKTGPYPWCAVPGGGPGDWGYCTEDCPMDCKVFFLF